MVTAPFHSAVAEPTLDGIASIKTFVGRRLQDCFCRSGEFPIFWWKLLHLGSERGEPARPIGATHKQPITKPVASPSKLSGAQCGGRGPWSARQRLLLSSRRNCRIVSPLFTVTAGDAVKQDQTALKAVGKCQLKSKILANKVALFCFSCIFFNT